MNDTCSNALFIREFPPISGQLLDAYDYDYYKFSLSSESLVSVELSSSINSKNIDYLGINLFNSDGDVIESFETGKDINFNTNLTEVGTYFLEVFTPGNFHTDEDYQIKVSTIDAVDDGDTRNIIKGSKTYKARLLHYYEQPENDNKKDDDACGLHLDHGGLTILTRAVYLDKDFKEVKEDDTAGLYVIDRYGKKHHCVIPENAVLCQVGEMLQVLSGGYLRSTPHYVKSSHIKNITRETFPVFIDCNVEQDIYQVLNRFVLYWGRVNIQTLKGRVQYCAVQQCNMKIAPF